MNATKPTKGNEPLDCVVVGAGPAGLTALTYLARFHRRVVALGGRGPTPRLLLIDRTYNLPGYPDGIAGAAMLRRLREQAEEMGGEVRDTVARRIDGKNGEFRVELQDGPKLLARKVILAMGVRDREPDVPGISPHVGGFLRYCPVCDGYEHTGKRLGILGCGPAVARHALFLRTFSDQITVFLHGETPDCLGRQAKVLEARGIAVYSSRVVRILERDAARAAEHSGCGVVLEDGTEHALSVLYGALGCDVNLAPVRHLGLKLDDEGYVLTNSRQETSLPGMYAAGDLVSDINQISVAFGQAAVAAVHLHNALADEDGNLAGE
jgi:thioredoxin reductase (NADPH)